MTWMLAIGVVLALVAAFLIYRAVRSRSRPGEAALADGQIALVRAAGAFLAKERFAVAGVSRSGDAAANFIFKRLKQSGREVYAINPNADTVEGEPCYPSLGVLPAAPEAVVIATHPDQALEVARQCRDAGVQCVWFHRSIDAGSFNEEAVELCAEYGAMVIPGGCPMMHLDPVDVPHRCMRFVLGRLGALPKATMPPRHDLGS